MNILGFNFEGPHPIDGAFNDVPGIYLILTSTRIVVDVGQTDKLGQRISSHERKSSWPQYGGTLLWFHHEPSLQSRLAKETQLRDTYNPVCGDR